MENEIVTFVIELSTPKMALKLLKHTVTQKNWIRKWHNVLLWVYGLCISHQVTYSTCLMRQHSSHVTALRIQLCAAYLLFKQIRNLYWMGNFAVKRKCFKMSYQRQWQRMTESEMRHPHMYTVYSSHFRMVIVFFIFFSLLLLVLVSPEDLQLASTSNDHCGTHNTPCARFTRRRTQNV